LLQKALALEPSHYLEEAKEADTAYTEANAMAFVGGYTVSGEAIESTVQNGIVKNQVSSFSVDQECMCSCNATEVGIFCLGASTDNAFSAVARKEGSNWIMEQQSIDGNVGGFNYHATFDFGSTPGGPRSVKGYALVSAGAVTTTQFSASQSGSGCEEGVGAFVCVSTCSKYGISSKQLAAKCGF